MTNDPLYHRLLESHSRGTLSEAEQAKLREWLAAHPEAQAAWEEDLSLNEGLARLPDVPLSSNFTARVLEAVDLEKAAEARSAAGRRFGWRPRPAWFMRAGSAALVLVTGWLAVHHSQVVERRNLAASLAVVANVSSMPSPRVLEDFEAIRVLSATPAADEELLGLMQ